MPTPSGACRLPLFAPRPFIRARMHHFDPATTLPTRYVAAVALPTLAHRRPLICPSRYLPPAGRTTDGTTRRREMQDIQHKAALRLAVHSFSPLADCARPFCHHWASDCQGRIGDYLTSARRHSYFRLWHQPSVRIGAVIAVDIGSALNQPLRRGPFLADGAAQHLSCSARARRLAQTSRIAFVAVVVDGGTPILCWGALLSSRPEATYSASR